MIEYIKNEGKLYGIIIRSHHSDDGIQFFTPKNFSQQLAYMKRPAGYRIAPHIHNMVPRNVLFTQEVLIIKSGKVQVDFYTDDTHHFESCIIYPGDVILLAAGGHGFKMIETSEIIEVKQGPYSGEEDKTRFDPC